MKLEVVASCILSLRWGRVNHGALHAQKSSAENVVLIVICFNDKTFNDITTMERNGTLFKCLIVLALKH